MQPKTIFSRLYRINVSMTDANVPFSFVAEDVSYPAPTPKAGESLRVLYRLRSGRRAHAAAARRDEEKGPLSFKQKGRA